MERVVADHEVERFIMERQALGVPLENVCPASKTPPSPRDHGTRKVDPREAASRNGVEQPAGERPGAASDIEDVRRPLA